MRYALHITILLLATFLLILGIWLMTQQNGLFAGFFITGMSGWCYVLVLGTWPKRRKKLGSFKIPPGGLER